MPHPQSKRAKASKRARAEERRARADEDRQASAERRVAHESDRLARRRDKRRVARAWRMGGVAVVVAIVGLVGYVLWADLRPGPELAGVERPSSEGRGHVNGAAYATNTPTSGAHASGAPACGVYSSPLDASLAVHALEHGAVVLWYDAENPELSTGLTEIANRWDSHVIVSPSTGLADPIVATAWNRLKTYPDVDPEIGEFVDTYRRRGPENVRCDQT